MSSLVFILGREPHLSVAEIAAVLGDGTEWGRAELSTEALVVTVNSQQSTVDSTTFIRRLGGTIKIGAVWRSVPHNGFDGADEAIGQFILEQTIANRKVHFGYSAYDFGGGSARVREVRESLRRGAAAQKARLEEHGRKVRWVTSREPTLSSVIVQKNDLLPERNGVEVLVLVSAEHLVLARTLAVQPFEEWGRRDYGRPSRDARSGMLPPKLARAMVNIALAPVSSNGFGSAARIGGVSGIRLDNNDTEQRYEQRHRQRLTKPFTLLDPFCGSGTILTEAMALGVPRIIGTDVDAKAVRDAKANVTWTQQRSFSPSRRDGSPPARAVLPLPEGEREGVGAGARGGGSGEREGVGTSIVDVRPCDVRQLSRCVRERVDAIVTEPYLGPPGGPRSTPTNSPSSRGGGRGGDAHGLRQLYLAAFREFARVLKPGGRAVFIVPVFREREVVLDITRDVARFGFHRIKPFPTPLHDHPIFRSTVDLPYARPDQRVGRKILVFEFRGTSPRTTRLSRKSRS